jgi:N-acylneuraminate cytidylyltransferase
MRPGDIQRGLDVLTHTGADFAVSVTAYPFPIQRAVRIDAHGRLSMFDPKLFAVRSQDLEAAFHDAAQFYWGRTEAWDSSDTLFGSSSAAVQLPHYRVQDIDTLDDWLRAEAMFRTLQADP